MRGLLERVCLVHVFISEIGFVLGDSLSQSSKKQSSCQIQRPLDESLIKSLYILHRA